MVSHTTGPKYLNDSFPMNSLLTLGIINVLLQLGSVFSRKRSFIISGHRLFLTLNISIATSWTLRWWIETDSFFLYLPISLIVFTCWISFVTFSFRLDNGGVIPLKDLVSKLIHVGLMSSSSFRELLLSFKNTGLYKPLLRRLSLLLWFLGSSVLYCLHSVVP